jgi:hypothetical protein
MKILLKSFVAGFLSTLIFHQGLLGLLFLAGISPKAPFDFTPVGPLGIPSVLSLAFFGGLWGLLIWHWVKNDSGLRFWIKSALLGAVGPTAVAFVVVFPLKGLPFRPIMIVFGLILNAAWGFGNSLIMKWTKGI